MTEAPSPAAIRALHLNSRLTGGGTDDQCVKTVHGLIELGADARIAGPEDREFSRMARRLGVTFVPTPAEGPLKLRFILAAARYVRRERIRIVHAHHGCDLWPAVLAARCSGVRPRLVLTRHLAKSPSSWFSRRLLLNRCDAMIAVSGFVARVLQEGVYEPASPEPERRARPPLRGDFSRIHVVRGGVDTARFRPADASAQRQAWGLAPGQYAFGVVGGYDLPRGKGQREFLRAAARIHARVPEARFLIVGRGNMERILRRDISELGLEGRAWLTPYAQDMPAAMNALDCLVHPQVGTEALGLVVLEAYACGRPVIASDLDGIPEAFAVGNHGSLVPAEDIGALAEAMAGWCRRPGLDHAKRQDLHERVAREFSLGASAARVLALYELLLNGAGDEEGRA